jgi:chromate reductase
MTTPIHVLGISGSLRRTSWNSGLLRAAADLLPPGMTIETFDLTPLPMFSQDLEAELPEAVRHFRERIASADALLFATPEYNYSISGVLKNAIDWASRPSRNSPLSDKPAAIAGAGGRFGTARAQLHLRQILYHVNMHVLNRPELMIPTGWEKFDAEGNLIHEQTREDLRGLLVALADWTRRLA